MCIICNMPTEKGVFAASDFLSLYKDAQRAMKAASDAMLTTAAIASNKEVVARYKRMHKQMVRLTRDWNQIEHVREVSGDDVSQSSVMP